MNMRGIHSCIASLLRRVATKAVRIACSLPGLFRSLAQPATIGLDEQLGRHRARAKEGFSVDDTVLTHYRRRFGETAHLYGLHLKVLRLGEACTLSEKRTFESVVFWRSLAFSDRCRSRVTKSGFSKWRSSANNDGYAAE
jgi:hypothetical protein